MSSSPEARAARSRWRADLLDYAADGLRTFGDTNTADAKNEAAEFFRLHADMTDRVQAARAKFNADVDGMIADSAWASAAAKAGLSADNVRRAFLSVLPKADKPASHAALQSLLDEITVSRQMWREIGISSGRRGRLEDWVVDHFAEPSDDELLGVKP